jgi:hypothetical protein
MKKIILLFTLISLYFTQNSFACHNSTINTVTSVNNGNGTTTYTINLTVDVGSSDGNSLGFALIFGSSATTPLVLTSPAFTPFLTRAGFNNLVGHTGTTIGSSMPGADFFSTRYANRTDILTYETNDGTFGFGSTDYTTTVVVTVQGCVESITLDADFRTLGTSVSNALCRPVFNTGVSCACSINALTAGTQTACNPATNTYTQQVTVTYVNPPATGTLNVNGQTFAITTSPQTVTLTGLTANGAAVNVTAVFSASATCTRTATALFTAPAACNACSITALSAGSQTACNPITNTYTQQVTVTYVNPPASGTLNVNGQTFAITTSPQTVTLSGLNANGAAVNVTAVFSASSTCTRTNAALFTAPAACNVSCTPNNGTWD